MLIYIIGKPRNQEELEAIWGHENIVFVDTVEEYRAHRDAQVGRTNAVHAIIEDELPMPTLTGGHDRDCSRQQTRCQPWTS